MGILRSRLTRAGVSEGVRRYARDHGTRGVEEHDTEILQYVSGVVWGILIGIPPQSIDGRNVPRWAILLSARQRGIGEESIEGVVDVAAAAFNAIEPELTYEAFENWGEVVD